MVSVSVRVDEDTKLAASRIAEDFGFDLSSVTRAFYKQIVRENRIPLNLSYAQPNLDSQEAIAEASKILDGGQQRFETVDEMFDSLGI